MSSSKSDLRSTSRDTNRLAAHKAKWAFGAKTSTPGRQATHHPRPHRPSDNGPASQRRYTPRGPNAVSVTAGEYDDDERSSEPDHTEAYLRRNSDSTTASPDEEEEDTNTAGAGGQTVFKGAVERAVRDFEERETAVLVRDEWSVLDGQGEEMGLSPVKKLPHAARRRGSGAARPGGGLRERALSFEGEYEIL